MPLVRRNSWIAHEINADIDSPANLIARAKKLYGTTTDLREAWFILPDGTMLDGMDPQGGRRDHSEINFVFERERTKPSRFFNRIYDFMEKTGAIRVYVLDDGDAHVNLTTAHDLTEAQWRILGQIIQNRIKNMRSYGVTGYFIIDINDPDEKLLFYKEFDVTPFLIGTLRRIYEGVKAGKVAKETEPKPKLSKEAEELLRTRKGYRCESYSGSGVSMAKNVLYQEIVDSGNEHMIDEALQALKIKGAPVETDAEPLVPWVIATLEKINAEINRRFGPTARAIWLATKQGVKAHYCEKNEEPDEYTIPAGALIISDLGSDGQLFLMSQKDWDLMQGKLPAQETDPGKKWDYGAFKLHPLWKVTPEGNPEMVIKPGDHLWRGTTTRFITPQGMLAHPIWTEHTPPKAERPRIYFSEGEEDAAGYAPILQEKNGGQPVLARLVLDQQLFKDLKPGLEGLGEWYVEREFIPRDRFTFKILTAEEKRRLAID